MKKHDTSVITYTKCLRNNNDQCHEGPETECRYISTLSLTSALDGVG